MFKLAKFLKPYTGSLILALVLIFLQSISNLFLPKLMSQIVDIGITNSDIPYILRIGMLMLVVALFGSIFTVIANLFSSKIAIGLSSDLRKTLFTKVESCSLAEFNHLGTASLITRTTNDVTQIQQLVLVALRIMVTAPLMILGGLLMALTTNLELSIILLLSIPLLLLVIFLVGKKGVPLFKAMQGKLDKVNLILRENLTGIRVIRAFNKIDYEEKRFNASNLDLTDNAIKVNKIIAALMPSMMIILNLTSVAILWFGGIKIDNGFLEVGNLIAFIQYVMQIMMSLVMLTMMFIIIPRASASAARINEILDLDFEIADKENAVRSTKQIGYVTFKDVSFSFPGSEEPALSHISFATKPGETTAIIGGTGSGKTTLIELIPRFHDISAGEILVDGVDVRDLSQETLRSKIGFVPQKAVLFSGSIKENLCYGKEDATDEEILHALDVSQASDFVSNMSDGINSFIAQGGTNVSGGQKQRLSIARALIRKPEVYIFDDSFSALDFKTDAILRKSLKDETKNASVIIVAQRITSIMDADQIIVLHEGRIVGIGTHKDLLEHCSIYKEIALSQLSKEELG